MLNYYLDIAIALVFVFLTLSLLSSIFLELVGSIFNLRGRALFMAIKGLMDESGTTTKLFEAFKSQPGIKSVQAASKREYPSYIDSGVYADSLINSLPDFYALPETYNDLEYRVKCLPAGNFKSVLAGYSALLPAEFKEKVSNWFNTNMDRFSGFYKRLTQKYLLIIGFVIALAINADTVSIFTQIQENEGLRVGLADEAGSVIANHATYLDYLESKRTELLDQGNSTDSIDRRINRTVEVLTHAEEELQKQFGEFNSASLIGWENEPTPPEERGYLWGLVKFAGFLITGAAISMGGPFWFDLLSKLTPLRGTGKKPEVK